MTTPPIPFRFCSGIIEGIFTQVRQTKKCTIGGINLYISHQLLQPSETVHLHNKGEDSSNALKLFDRQILEANALFIYLFIVNIAALVNTNCLNENQV